jgi:hypothetical protein
MQLSAARLTSTPSLTLTKRYGGTVAIIGTGPSLKLQQIETARRKGFTLFGCNNVWELTELAVHYACNEAWWERYWSPVLAATSAEKWTCNPAAAKKYGLNWVAEKNARGLSTDPSVIHHGHGSGYTLLNIAYLLGAERIVLLGYDMKYAPDYNGHAQQIGESQRHYFGEYPDELQHWPKMRVKNGVHEELVELYRSVAAQGLVEIINCTPASAIDCFPRVGIDAL